MAPISNNNLITGLTCGKDLGVRLLQVAAPTIQRLCGLCSTWYAGRAAGAPVVAGVKAQTCERKASKNHLDTARTNLRALLPISFAARWPRGFSDARCRRDLPAHAYPVLASCDPEH